MSSRHSLFQNIEAKLNIIAEKDSELRMTIPVAYIEGIKP